MRNAAVSALAACLLVSGCASSARNANPKPDAEYHRNRAKAFIADRKHFQANDEYFKAMKMAPKSASLRVEAGAYFLSRRDYLGANICFEQLAKLEPEAYRSHFHLGQAQYGLRKMGAFYPPPNIDRAFASFTKSLELKPDAREARVARILAALEGAKVMIFEVRDDIDWLLRKNGSDAEAYYLRGLLEYRTGSKANAERDINRAIELDPSKLEYPQTLVRMKQYEKDSQTAVLFGLTILGTWLLDFPPEE